jgi:hypothetical protein
VSAFSRTIGQTHFGYKPISTRLDSFRACRYDCYFKESDE